MVSWSADLHGSTQALVEALIAREPIAAAEPDSIIVVRAPGRVNLIGDHTDYNDGLVLPAAIDLGISIAFVAVDDARVELTLARTGERAEIDLGAIGPAQGSWRDYVAGTAWALLEAGAEVRGFRGVLASDLPIGAGLSSSASLELASAWALTGGRRPFGDCLATARVAQRAENEYVGVACGIMDQFATACGVPGAALLLDCRSLEHRVVPLTVDDIALLICDSGVSRRLLSSGYGDRRAECERAARALARLDGSVRTLRDATMELLDAARTTLDDVAWRRARHVVSENQRVVDCVRAFEEHDYDKVGEVFAASHGSLRDDFEVSTPELDRLVEIATGVPGAIGSRLTGAGFGGATINLVHADAIDRFVDAIHGGYRGPGGAYATVRRVTPADGAGVVWPRAS